MIQEFDLRNIVSSYSLHDCYIERVEYKDGLLKLYIDEILPETEAGYDDPEDFSNKYKGLIVTYKIIDENQCYLDISKKRYILAFRYHKNKSLELTDFVAFFNKIKKNDKNIVEIRYQYFTNSRCLIQFDCSLPNYAIDFCDLNLHVESITYEWREKSLDSLCKEIK